jgi:hypothetical protein
MDLEEHFELIQATLDITSEIRDTGDIGFPDVTTDGLIDVSAIGDGDAEAIPF